MKKFSAIAAHPLASRMGNIILRIGSLGAKLVLTLYMGRFLGLAEMGKYGLVTAYVSVMVTVLGFRFDYVVSRDIIDVSPLAIARKIRDQMVFYGLNYLGVAVLLAAFVIHPIFGLSVPVILLTFVLSVLESMATQVTANIVSLHRPIFSNVLFFIRAAAWTVPAMLMGLLSPSLRTAEVIFYWWMGGITLSLLVAYGTLRYLPWKDALRSPVDWLWIKTGVAKCFLIWLGAIGSSASTYVDRFVVEHFLGLEFAGIASFYGSFCIAIQSLLQSGVFTFSYPRLISYYRKGELVLFWQELRKMTLQSSLIAAFVAVVVGVAVPQLGPLFHRPEFARYEVTFWLMLFSVWLRSSTDSLYYVLYARSQDRLVWMGGLVILIPAFGSNLLFVPMFGFQGIGYSAVLVAVFLCTWRVYCLTHFKPKPHQ